MSDQSMFSSDGDDTNTNESDNSQSNTNPFEDKLKAIVNDNGEPKYRDVNAALEGLAHSQTFIETLKQEKQQQEQELLALKQELEKRDSVEAALEKLTSNRAEPPKVDPPKETGLDGEAVKALVTATLQEERRGAQAEANLNKVVTELASVHGENAKEHIAKRARELDTTPADLEKLARTNPVMALQLLGGGKQEKTNPVTTSRTSPPTTQEDGPPKFEKSLVQGGATNQELLEASRKMRDYTYKRLGVET